MRSCLRRRKGLGALHQTSRGARTSPIRPSSHRTTHVARHFAHVADARIRNGITSLPSRFEKFRLPNDTIPRGSAAWLTLLDRGLPSHLRQDRDAQDDALSTVDLARVLLTSQWKSESVDGLDLLYHLGMVQDRWQAVVWLVKHLVETFAPPPAQSDRPPSTISAWTSEESLAEITSQPNKAQRLVPRRPSPHSLDELTESMTPRFAGENHVFRHQIIGSIWRSLGLMSIACSHGEIKPEILEIIAYLHHMEIMPASIYNQRPSMDTSSTQYPPMLNLFSSKILTSLSDAAWRARERLVAEEAESTGGRPVPLRPETPGIVYRVDGGGLRPEVWLELVLWSCLHGGWISEGASILSALHSEPDDRQWKAISWASLIAGVGQTEDWDKLGYILNTYNTRTKGDRQHGSPTSVRRTVSGEVVSAYVNALLTSIRQGVGERGMSPKRVLQDLTTFRDFLSRSDLNLQSGSWDAVILRFVDAHDAVFNQSSNMELLMGLSPSIGEGLSSQETQNLPDYVLDGSAAVLGLFHRALRSRIVAGDIRDAVKLFRALQHLVDKNKRRSVHDFLRKNRKRSRLFASVEGLPPTGPFTSNFTGIEYPAFNAQIPPNILGSFMELIVDSKAYDLGRWLLYSEEIDGPVLPPEHYGHPAVMPALVRFAAATNDSKLLSDLVQARRQAASGGEVALPKDVLQSFFESQVNLQRWDAAARILEHMKQVPYTYWNAFSLAHVIRAALFQTAGAMAGDEAHVQNLAHSKQLLLDMVKGKYERVGERPGYQQEQVRILLAMLAVQSQNWSEYCSSLLRLDGVYSFGVPVRAFNMVLEGVVTAYGSAAGRSLLTLFWPDELRQAQQAGRTQSREEPGGPQMARFLPSVLDGVERQRIAISLPGRSKDEMVIYGGLSPNQTTIRIILRKAIQEAEQGKKSEGHPPLSSVSSDDSTGSFGDVDGLAPEITAWAIPYFRSLRMTDEDIRVTLSAMVSEHHHDDCSTH